LTSNAGSELTASLCADATLAPDQDALREALAPELLKVFPAAFLGRVTVVPYRPLVHASLASIVRLHMNRVVRRMADSHGIALHYNEQVIDYIVSRCLVQETGARMLIGFIEQHVLPRLSALWLDAFSSKRVLSSIEIHVGDSNAAPAAAFVFASANKAAVAESLSPVSVGETH
jgi:type VI secretion system protein VasG